MRLNILLTSVGRRTYLVKYFKMAIANRGKVHVANSSALSPAFLEADESVVVPKIYDPEYIPFLIEYCKKNRITAIISLFDIDLPILAKNKQRFKEIGTKVLVSDPDFVDICNDKWKTFLFLRKNNIETPRTYLNIEDAKKDLERKVLSFPLMVKPRWGMGSISVHQADDGKELEVFYNKVKRTVMHTYLKYESIQDADECVIIQEKLDGTEYGLDVINDLQGRYLNTSVKMKIAMRSGETDCAITVDDLSLKKIGEQLAKISRHIGNLDIDVYKGKNDHCYVLEMNARFGGGYPFSHLAGVDLPQAIVNWLEGKEVAVEMLTPNIGVLGQKDIELVQLPQKALK